jgi:Rhodanese-like domain
MTMAVCSHLNQITLTEPPGTAPWSGMPGRGLRRWSWRDGHATDLRTRTQGKAGPWRSLKLVNALGDWEYRAAHIPGSLHFSTPEEALRGLSRDDEIVVHCSNPSCMASVALYQLLERNGYRNCDASLAACRSGRRQVPAGRAMVDAQGDGPRT